MFFVITFVSIKIWTPQNDFMNLSFVKDKHVVGKKMARYGLKDYLSVAIFLEFAELAWGLRLHLRP